MKQLFFIVRRFSSHKNSQTRPSYVFFSAIQIITFKYLIEALLRRRFGSTYYITSIVRTTTVKVVSNFSGNVTFNRISNLWNYGYAKFLMTIINQNAFLDDGSKKKIVISKKKTYYKSLINFYFGFFK